MELGEEGKIACPFLRYKILREQRFFKLSVFCQYIMLFSFFRLCSLPRSNAFTFHQHGVSSRAFGAL